ncbi:hypothetical protein ISN75_14100 [Dyella marensis]|uniref:hypothetical protein n=1 Tax=Dyella marensis TaxID=500610 RepID=UPI0031DE4873
MTRLDDILKEAQKLYEERLRDDQAPIDNVPLFLSLHRDIENDLYSKKHQFESMRIGITISPKNAERFTVRLQADKTVIDVVVERRRQPRLGFVGLARDPEEGAELNYGEPQFFNDESTGKEQIYRAVQKALTELVSSR